MKVTSQIRGFFEDGSSQSSIKKLSQAERKALNLAIQHIRGEKPLNDKSIEKINEKINLAAQRIKGGAFDKSSSSKSKSLVRKVAKGFKNIFGNRVSSKNLKRSLDKLNKLEEETKEKFIGEVTKKAVEESTQKTMQETLEEFTQELIEETVQEDIEDSFGFEPLEPFNIQSSNNSKLNLQESTREQIKEIFTKGKRDEDGNRIPKSFNNLGAPILTFENPRQESYNNVFRHNIRTIEKLIYEDPAWAGSSKELFFKLIPDEHLSNRDAFGNNILNIIKDHYAESESIAFLSIGAGSLMQDLLNLNKILWNKERNLSKGESDFANLQNIHIAFVDEEYGKSGEFTSSGEDYSEIHLYCEVFKTILEETYGVNISFECANNISSLERDHYDITHACRIPYDAFERRVVSQEEGGVINEKTPLNDYVINHSTHSVVLDHYNKLHFPHNNNLKA